MKLHISLYELPDGMIVATCAELPMCRVLRGTREHAFQDCKQIVLKYLRERKESGQSFQPELRAVDFPIEF